MNDQIAEYPGTTSVIGDAILTPIIYVSVPIGSTITVLSAINADEEKIQCLNN
jgi:hypothetical protein